MDEKLKKMLEDGILTQEQYDSLMNDGNADGETEPDEPSNDVKELAEKLAKQMTDKTTAKMGKELAKVKAELEKQRKQNLSDKELKALEDMKVSVGVTGKHAWLARIHEYGMKIQVTPKMRAYLHSKGLHLKDSTQFITIPERAFMRNGFKESKEDVLNTAKSVIGDVINGNLSIDDYGQIVGSLLQSKIHDYAEDLRTPANHPFTVKEKGSSNPLIDTGNMKNSIGFEVEKG